MGFLLMSHRTERRRNKTLCYAVELYGVFPEDYPLKFQQFPFSFAVLVSRTVNICREGRIFQGVRQKLPVARRVNVLLVLFNLQNSATYPRRTAVT